MKIRFLRTFFNSIIVVLLLAAVVSSCNKSNSTSGVAPGTTSISAILKNANDATLFSAALARVHLDTVLDGSGPFTIFVPTDASFAASGINQSTLDKLSDDSLKYLLLYHTVAANLLSSSLPAGPNAKIVTANGDSIFVTNTANAIYINGFPLLAADVLASNGVIHALQRALIPPRGNILQNVQSDTSFSFFAAAIARGSQGTTDISTMLATGGPYTLFTPINDGFRAAGFATIDDINNANADSIANIVLYHILPSRTFSSDMASGQTATTLNDSTIVFSVGNNTRQVKGDKNDSPSNTLAINVMATNGVLFVIDQLLKP